jgi:hypothetical protein
MFFALCSAWLYGQTGNIATSVKFDNDRHTLRQDAKQTINEIVEALDMEKVVKITIEGHTDNTADSLYNVRLSERRAMAVKDYLTSKGFDSEIIQTAYFGREKPLATNENETGKQKNRRTDIVFQYDKPKPEKKEIVQVIEEKKCKEDTTIILLQGTQIVFNLCEYLKIKDCLDIVEILTPQDVLDNGLSLMTIDGCPLASCGMIKVGMKEHCGDRFTYPLKIYFPVPENPECDYCGINALIWDITVEGWVEAQDDLRKVNIVEIRGKKFYEFELQSANVIKNCDCLIKGTCGCDDCRPTKFKIRRGYEIVNLKITYECPTAVIEIVPEEHTHIVRQQLPCWSKKTTVLATVANRRGELLTLEQRDLYTLRKGRFYMECGQKKDLIIRKQRYNKILPRKYVITPKMLTSK